MVSRCYSLFLNLLSPTISTYMSDDKRPSTDPYKGVRDFYPEDMAIQRYIFDTWAKAAESFGFERYDASILEPSELYRAKAAENEEIVNEQTYTFVDKGDREVTLRPEMTPTVARMVAGRRRELSLPVRWYSIPNLFRYERAQRGRLREHWQLNCDIFGTHSVQADVEIIALAASIFKVFGAKDSDFEIRINNRAALTREIESKLRPGARINDALKLLDTKPKIDAAVYAEEEAKLLTSPITTEGDGGPEITEVIEALRARGVTNAFYGPTIVRGFNYYTGTIFEIFDTNPDNRRSLLGGGRYDNLTALFGGDPIPAVGFGFGDVTMRDFLETHDLLSKMPAVYKSAPTVLLATADAGLIAHASLCASVLRDAGIRTAVNLSDKSIGEQRKKAAEAGVRFAINIESKDATEYTMRDLASGEETTGTIAALAEKITQR